jgi:hypothetical protein
MVSMSVFPAPSRHTMASPSSLNKYDLLGISQFDWSPIAHLPSESFRSEVATRGEREGGAGAGATAVNGSGDWHTTLTVKALAKSATSDGGRVLGRFSANWGGIPLILKKFMTIGA